MKRTMTLSMWCGALSLLLGTAMPARALGICNAPPLPESRTVGFEATMFQQGTADLSAAGRARIGAYAQGLAPASLEAVVISVPAPAGPGQASAQALARLRANAVRMQLVADGVPREQIYLEQREARVPAAVALAAPLTIETVGAWPRQAALHRGWRCMT